jgi:hypothetical protein
MMQGWLVLVAVAGCSGPSRGPMSPVAASVAVVGAAWQRFDDAALTRRAVQAFSSEAVVVAAAQECANESGATNCYATPEVAMFRSSKRALVVVGKHGHSHSCDEAWPTIYMVYEVSGARLVPRGQTNDLPTLAEATDAQTLPALVSEDQRIVPDDAEAYLPQERDYSNC